MVFNLKELRCVVMVSVSFEINQVADNSGTFGSELAKLLSDYKCPLCTAVLYIVVLWDLTTIVLVLIFSVF